MSTSNNAPASIKALDTIKQFVAPLLVSAIVTLIGAVSAQRVDSRLLEDNIQATKDLGAAVHDLRYQLGVFSERYVTREELDRKVSELKREKHGA